MKKILPAVCAAFCAIYAQGGNVSVYDLGGFTFYALNNNTGVISEDLIASSVPFEKTPGWNENALNYFVLDTGKVKVLFDAGTPDSAGGKVAERLKEAGLSPQEIDIICLTHMHYDHIGGLLDAEGKKVFPKAKIYAAAEEAAYWEQSGNALAAAVLKEYKNSFIKFPQNMEITAGVRSVPLFGHTPGHTGYVIESKGKKLLVWGDLTHFLAQFKTPALYLKYDWDPIEAAQTRQTILRRAAEKKFYIAGMHVAKPGAGRAAETSVEPFMYTFIPGIK
ncbi:hypothetical protein FACS189437_05930 [Bacteroidia bacterium]|nr:hypothetical protein FACS189437_05930 [Bacteroidia bacterium]